ncbi:MAG: multicopper oxidase domain-containing protein [Polyangiaceae bacterium]
MKMSRRNILLAAGSTTLASAAASAATSQAPAADVSGYTPVHTLNGWTLPYKMVDGVKEFHLVAEEVDHEFAPGLQSQMLGLQRSSTPGRRSKLWKAIVCASTSPTDCRNLPRSTGTASCFPRAWMASAACRNPQSGPGETFVYEFTLRQNGTHMYHPHADEMVQMAAGMMGLFIIHPRRR